MPLAVRGIEMEDDEALAGERLVPDPPARPAVVRHGRVRPAVGHEPDRVFLARVQVGRQDQLALEQEAVLGADLHALVRAETVLLEPIHGVGVHDPHELPSAAYSLTLGGV